MSHLQPATPRTNVPKAWISDLQELSSALGYTLLSNIRINKLLYLQPHFSHLKKLALSITGNIPNEKLNVILEIVSNFQGTLELITDTFLLKKKNIAYLATLNCVTTLILRYGPYEDVIIPKNIKNLELLQNITDIKIESLIKYVSNLDSLIVNFGISPQCSIEPVLTLFRSTSCKKHIDVKGYHLDDNTATIFCNNLLGITHITISYTIIEKYWKLFSEKILEAGTLRFLEIFLNVSWDGIFDTILKCPTFTTLIVRGQLRLTSPFQTYFLERSKTLESLTFDIENRKTRSETFPSNIRYQQRRILYIKKIGHCVRFLFIPKCLHYIQKVCRWLVFKTILNEDFFDVRKQELQELHSLLESKFRISK